MRKKYKPRSKKPARKTIRSKQKIATHPKPKTPSIEFCKKCGSIMLPEKKTKNIYLKCRSCGYEIKKNIHDMKISEELQAKERVIVLEKNEVMLPITEMVCSECNNKKAYYWLQQTRSADEPPTQFFRCTKCKHVWREYK
jgi:transcription factor S